MKKPTSENRKTIALYLIFGGLTTLVSIGIYWLLTEVLWVGVLLANVISWIGAVTFAYVTNSIWVFAQRPRDWRELISQAARFFSARLITLGIEEVMLFVFISLLALPNMPVKLGAQAMVIVLNYLISRLFVFSKK